MQVNFNGMGFNPFEIMGEVVKYDVKVWVGDALVENTKMTMPSMQAQLRFQQIVQDLANNPSPMKVEFGYKTEVVGSENIDTISFTNKPWDNSHPQEGEGD